MYTEGFGDDSVEAAREQMVSVRRSWEIARESEGGHTRVSP